MIQKIAIVPYVTYGRLAQAGYDGHLNVFKKKRSAVLKENLEAAISEEHRGDCGCKPWRPAGAAA